MPCDRRRASWAGSALGGGLRVSEKRLRRATWGVGLTGHPAVRRWGAGPQLGLVLPSPILGGFGGRADRGVQELGSQVRSAGAVGAQPGIGLVSPPGRLPRTEAWLGQEVRLWASPERCPPTESFNWVLWGTLGSSSLCLASLEPWAY